MDITYMRYNNKTYNSSGFGAFDFISENPEISIPYLALISAFTLNGCVGNVMVIGAVLAYKVNIFVVSLLYEYHFCVPDHIFIINQNIGRN